ncbi:MAG: biotin/lipoate A/B protein ligase family protein [Planctomycetota bacterium]|jgi:lipoate-protein ligase A
MSGASILVLEDSPRTGVENMQIDQQLLLTADPWEFVSCKPSDKIKPSILVRFYYWSEPTLSLGNFQSINELEHAGDTLGHPELASIPWVQRKTGGGAILHDQEVTYSIVVPSDDSGVALSGKGHSEKLYRAVHESVVAGLVDLGLDASLSEACTCSVAGGKGKDKEPFLCFHRRTPVDVVVGNHKVLGSAQRRVKSGLLQHGSFLVSKSPYYPTLLGVGDLAQFPPAYRGFQARGSQEACRNWQDWLESRIFQAIWGLIGPTNEIIRLNLRDSSVRIP